MHPGAVAGAVPDERELALAHELDLVVGGARPVERAVSHDCAASLDDDVLEVAYRHCHLARRRASVQGQRVLLGLHPPALANSVPVCVALRDEVVYARRIGGV